MPRGTPLLTPGAWRRTTTLDVRLGADPSELPGTVVVHLGTVALNARLRPLGGYAARLTLTVPMPLVAGDRAILRAPGGHGILAGALVLDADPPALERRGDGRRRADELASATGVPDLAVEVGRRGAMTVAHAVALGVPVVDRALSGSGRAARGLAGRDGRARRLGDAPRRRRQGAGRRPAARPVAAGVDGGVGGRPARPGADGPRGAAGRARGARGAGLAAGGERLAGPGRSGLAAIEARLAADPFAAPERPELAAAGLGARELAAAERLGRVLRLPDDVVLLPSGPAQAMRRLSALPQPFTTSQARQALGTTRRVVIPLLEHLDGRGWTRRVDATQRVVVR